LAPPHQIAAALRTPPGGRTSAETSETGAPATPEGSASVAKSPPPARAVPPSQTEKGRAPEPITDPKA